MNKRRIKKDLVGTKSRRKKWNKGLTFYDLSELELDKMRLGLMLLFGPKHFGRTDE